MPIIELMLEFASEGAPPDLLKNTTHQEAHSFLLIYFSFPEKITEKDILQLQSSNCWRISAHCSTEIKEDSLWRRRNFI